MTASSSVWNKTKVFANSVESARNSSAVLEEPLSTEVRPLCLTLPSLCPFQAKQLEKKEAELQHLAAFYKEQLHILEKKVRTTLPSI